jgi:hypothetical protein
MNMEIMRWLALEPLADNEFGIYSKPELDQSSPFPVQTALPSNSCSARSLKVWNAENTDFALLPY